jgi:hypothetical protein
VCTARGKGYQSGPSVALSARSLSSAFMPGQFLTECILLPALAEAQYCTPGWTR